MTEVNEPDWIRAIQRHRSEKEATFADEEASPLSESATQSFEGLSWFPIDEPFRVSARLERLDEPQSEPLDATHGPPMTYNHVGQLGVEFDGELTVLSVYQAPGVEPLLLPFRDVTNGDSTWQHGRYLPIFPPETTESNPASETVTADFNLAYHPLCVYDETVRSAKPPTANEIPVSVRAGERL